MEDIRENVEKMMRHDLKNALCGILGFTELLRGAENLSDSQRYTISVIHKSGSMMLSQVEGYLALQKMESGVFEIDGLPVDIVALSRDVLRTLEKQADDKNVHLRLTLDGAAAQEGAARLFSTQPALFYSMLINLAKNAVEASPIGESVLLDLSFEGETLRVRIHNEGAVPLEIRDKFFGKFVTAKKKDGLGLGAYSARRIARSLGGHISMESDETRGTTIRIDFKAKK